MNRPSFNFGVLGKLFSRLFLVTAALFRKNATARQARAALQEVRLDQKSAPLKISPHSQSSCPLPSSTTVTRLHPSELGASRWRKQNPSAYSDAGFGKLVEMIRGSGGNTVPIKARPIRVVASNTAAEVGGPTSNTPESVGGYNVAAKEPLYEIVYGHRRWRACALWNLPVAVIIEDMDDAELVRQMLEENSGLRELSAYEKGLLYQQLLTDEMFTSARKLASTLRIDAGSVSRCLKLLTRH